MNTTIVADTLLKQTATATGEVRGNNISIWLWIALIEFCIIVFLLIKQRKNSDNGEKQKIKQKVMASSIDFENTVNSFFHSQALYNELIRRCHPDRFPNDTEKQEIANNISQEITKNKLDYKRLSELKEQARQQLNISF
jgi:hypothetical protein